MNNLTIEVKQSKLMFTIAFCSCGIILFLFLGLFIFFLIHLFDVTITNDEYIVYILSLIFSLSFAIVLIVVFVYLIYIYKRQIDIYTADKMCRKIGDKIVFELPYSQIETVRNGFCSVFFVLHKGIVKTNGKKGPRNFYEHYSEQDIYKIKQLIYSYKTCATK